MTPTPIRDRKARDTRTRIAAAALDLFVSRGFAETTIDQIAAAAGVGRRTIFRHFATKEAILFDHLVVRRNAAVELLRERPLDEPALVSLHAVLRELCVQGYDRRALAQMKDVLASNPELASAEISRGIRAFQHDLTDTLQSRLGEEASFLEIQALTFMALCWVVAATCVYHNESGRSLVECFDEVVVVCLGASARELSPSLDGSGAPSPLRSKRRTRTAA